MIWRILKATAVVGGWVLAALVLAYVENIVVSAPGNPNDSDL